MTTAALIYPHQLFENHPAIAGADLVFLVEDPLFFRQYRFHRQKLLLHRASMKRYAADLTKRGHRVRYADAMELRTTGSILTLLKEQVKEVRVVDPCDDWLERRLTAALNREGIRLRTLDDPHFLTPIEAIDNFVHDRDKFFFTDFYIAQRKRLGILLDRGKPRGGKWSFDPDNRKKLPAKIDVPRTTFPKEDRFVREARDYVRTQFPDALGSDEEFRYPTSHADAETWLREFVENRLDRFGDYEDAISRHHEVMFHSLLTPILNIGLLSPRQVIDAILDAEQRVPLNSREGFVRQVIGWREFVRLVYRTRGRRQRTRNFWRLHHELPQAFYEGSTGIEPVDHVIRTVLRTGYCHHIERLMILGNFLLLCDVKPDAVYQWFMELFIDAYDWVMVPNVYGMSQHADGGLMTTKPYISGSSYVLKMSDFKRGDWCRIWDALYWRFIDQHTEFFAGNPRTSVMTRMKDKLGPKLSEHHRIAEEFLTRLHGLSVKRIS